jgi:hypothetical protein
LCHNANNASEVVEKYELKIDNSLIPYIDNDVDNFFVQVLIVYSFKNLLKSIVVGRHSQL